MIYKKGKDVLTYFLRKLKLCLLLPHGITNVSELFILTFPTQLQC